MYMHSIIQEWDDNSYEGELNENDTSGQIMVVGKCDCYEVLNFGTN